MQTIAEAARELKTMDQMLRFGGEGSKRAYSFEEIFKGGVDFANKWISTSEEMPICYRTGDYDGKQSDLVLCQDGDGNISLAECCFFREEYEWYTQDNFAIVAQIVKWRPVERT